MKNLNLKLTGLNSKIIPQITIDNNIVKCKKNEFGSYETTYQTEKDEIEISLTRDLELKSKLWWLFALISFIVSIFGIFEPLYDRKNVTINSKFKVKLNDENNINLKFNTFSPQGKAVEIETQNEYQEISNEYTVDKKAKTRWIILLVIKIVVWIGLAILLGYLIMNKI